MAETMDKAGMIIMSTKLGRNQSCWCGSGKKYKHCHQSDDQEKGHVELSPTAPVPPAPAPLPPRFESDRAQRNRFDPADFERKVSLFQETLAAGSMDAEEAWKMLVGIRDKNDPCHNPLVRTRYAELIEQLRCEAPDIYHGSRAFYNSNLINDAITDGRWEAIPELLGVFAENPEEEINLFFDIIDKLMYHGQAPVLLDTMRQIWPETSESDKLTPWGMDRFREVLLTLNFFNYLETQESPRVDDPALHEALSPYGELEDEWLEQAVRYLTAPAPSAWEPADFGEEVDADRLSVNITALLFEFMADQYRQAGVPFSKGELTREQLTDLLLEQSGQPPEMDGTGRTVNRPSRGIGGPKEPAPTRPPSCLVPRRALLDPLLGNLFDFFGARPYLAGCLIESLPAYLHFLARLGLIHPSEMDDTLAALRPLAGEVYHALDNYGVDLLLLEAVADTWLEPALTALQDDPALAAARKTPLSVPTPLPTESPRRPGALQTYTFQVTYLWGTDDVRRKIEIAENQTLDDLHEAIQSAVDFDRDHMYSFFMSGRAWDKATQYASPHGEGRSAAQVRIGDLRLRMKQRFLYLFDYGDEHHFEVQLVDINPDAPKNRYPRLVEKHGKNPSQYGDWD